MAEVEKQLKPFKEELALNTGKTIKLEKWQLGMWSNGSGGPPGYLEIAREQDKANFAKIFELLDPYRKLKQWLSVLAVVLTFLGLLMTMFIWLEGRKVATGELEIPLNWLKKEIDPKMPTVYAKSAPSPQSAHDRSE